jgi:hypothetical protein
LERELRATRERVARLERVADAVVAASCWDHAVYEAAPGPDWLVIDRDDWADLLCAIADLDTWRPWEARS